MSHSPFEIVALPNDPELVDFQRLAQRYRDFRLHALKTSPKAFAASYEVENGRELQHTVDRLSNPKALHLIALARSESDNADQATPPDHDDSLTTRWLGVIVLLGPEEALGSSAVSAQSDPFSRMTGSIRTANGTHRVDDSRQRTLRFHLNGVFVDPEARKAGVGRGLIDAALREAASTASKISLGWSCSILVDSENTAARKLYEQAGFVVTGQEAYMQQPRSLVVSKIEPMELIAFHMELSHS